MAITFVDRVPTKPNRILITPEDGSAAFYATWERADEPTTEGTPLNAKNLNEMQFSGWTEIGSWGKDGKLEHDFSDYNELLFVYRTHPDNLSECCHTSLVVPVSCLVADTVTYWGATYSSSIYFKIKVSLSEANTYVAYYSGSASSKYSITCYGR